MNLEKTIVKIRRALGLHKWSIRAIWIEEEPENCFRTTIEDICELCGERRVAPFGGEKYTIFSLPKEYYKS